MPLIQFICPDNNRIGVRNCLAGCRMNHRCVALSTLTAIAGTERVWDGRAHVTDLLNGTMYCWLRITKPYAIKPKSRAYALLGSTHHKLIEEKNQFPSEIKVELIGIQGSVDSLEPNNNYKAGMLYFDLVDNKTWGSYKAMKALGLEEAGKIPDPSGARYSRSGKWGQAGSPKMIPQWRENPAKVDLVDEQVQLNFYRMALEDKGYPIADLKIQIVVRDGMSQVAYSRGVMESMYFIDVIRVEDSVIINFLNNQYTRLKLALEKGWYEPCLPHERWDDRRCLEYCDVWEDCPHGRLVRQQKGGDEN